MTTPPIKHGQGRDEQDEQEDSIILLCLIVLVSFFLTVAGSFALGYWYASL